MENGKQDALIRRPDGSLTRYQASPERVVPPVADLYETPDAFVMKLDMPGAMRESIDLSIGGDVLTIRGSIASTDPGSARVLINEINRKRYLREFNLGDGIDRERVEARFEEGVLTVLLPKTEAAKPRTIPIR